MNPGLIKFKGARPHSPSFPYSDNMYKVAPFTYRDDILPPLISRKDFFSSDLEQRFNYDLSDKNSKAFDRKWNKERIYCFGDNEREIDEIYQTLRAEEKIYSKALVNKSIEIVSELNHQRMFAKITQGSHSPNKGMGVGGYMSWLDGDVNITLFLDIPSYDIYNESVKLFPNHNPYTAGGRIFFDTKHLVNVKNMPLTKDVTNWETSFGISIASLSDFERNHGGLGMWYLLANNGHSIDEKLLHNFESMRQESNSFKTHPIFSDENLTHDEFVHVLERLSLGNLGFDNHGTPEFYSESTRLFYEHVLSEIEKGLDLEDFAWTTKVVPAPNIEFYIKNKEFRIVGEKYI